MKKKIGLIGIAAVVAAFLFLVVLRPLNRSTARYLTEFKLDEKSFDHETLQMIEEDFGIKFPIGSHGVYFFNKPPMDPWYEAEIVIPGTSKDEMISQILGFGAETQGKNNPGGERKIKLSGEVLIDHESYLQWSPELRRDVPAPPENAGLYRQIIFVNDKGKFSIRLTQQALG